jgi:hypothetical protein
MKTTTTAKILVLSVAMLLSGVAQATIISLGQINLTGNFTLNHHYNFNNPSAFPFGPFGTLTVQDATGIFAPYVASGDTLGMNTQFMFGPITPINWDVSSPMIWSIGGFTLDTQHVLIKGADSGRNCLGITDLSGNGFDPSSYGLGAFSRWVFTAPPYDIRHFDTDITGPISLQIAVGYDNGHVPDTGATLGFLAVSLFGLLCTRSLVIRIERMKKDRLLVSGCASTCIASYRSKC